MITNTWPDEPPVEPPVGPPIKPPGFQLDTDLPPCCFVSNLPDIIVSSVFSPVYVTIYLDDVHILDAEKMVGDENMQVTIRTAHILRNRASLTKPEEFTAPLPILTVIIAKTGQVSQTAGQVIIGETSQLGAINEEWFAQNFLTWQPQSMETTAEQPQWLSFIPQQRDTVLRIETRLYASDGRITSRIIRAIETSSILNYVQIRTDFNHLWEGVCREENIEPICYDVYGYEIYLDESGIMQSIKNQPYAQRYILRPPQYRDICFGFENTIGGFDTIMAQGNISYLPDGGSTSFRNDTTELEISNDYTSIWEASSGQIETEREASQFQDFFKSKNRYVLKNGVWQRIVIKDYKIKHTRAEINAYTFKYHLAEKNEGRYYSRNSLNGPTLPTKIDCHATKTM